MANSFFQTLSFSVTRYEFKEESAHICRFLRMQKDVFFRRNQQETFSFERNVACYLFFYLR